MSAPIGRVLLRAWCGRLASGAAAAAAGAQHQGAQQCASSCVGPCSSPWALRVWRGFAASAGRGTHTPSAAAGAATRPAAAATRPAAAASRPAAGTAAAAAAGGAAAGPAASGGSGRWWARFQAVPTVPKVLGLAGVIPFIGLAPPVAKHLAGVLPADVVDNAAMVQVSYAVTIVTFLGAVHWGVAMSSSSTLAALGARAATRIANEAYVYSVLPCLVAWPVALMEPGAGSMVMCFLLPALFAADFTRRNWLPAWYLALRLPLTLGATFGMLLTATRHLHSELDRAQAITREATAAASAAGAVVEAAAPAAAGAP